jgi:hypothetical protein
VRQSFDNAHRSSEGHRVVGIGPDLERRVDRFELHVVETGRVEDVVHTLRIGEREGRRGVRWRRGQLASHRECATQGHQPFVLRQ